MLRFAAEFVAFMVFNAALLVICIPLFAALLACGWLESKRSRRESAKILKNATN